MVAVFFGILEKHAVSAVQYFPRFQYLRAGCKIEGRDLQIWKQFNVVKTGQNKAKVCTLYAKIRYAGLKKVCYCQ